MELKFLSIGAWVTFEDFHKQLNQRSLSGLIVALTSVYTNTVYYKHVQFFTFKVS
jgi:hypothetical protein